MNTRAFFRALNVTLFVGFLLCVFGVLLHGRIFHAAPKFGVTYSIVQARFLGLDERETYIAILDDLGVKNVRLPIYWDEIEKMPDEYNWSTVDYLMDESAKRGVAVTLVVGYKVPRWPECHIPEYVKGMSSDGALERRLIPYLEAAVGRYKDHPALARIQVENEPFFPFGDCPVRDPALFKKEVETVKHIDPVHPVMLTMSGEQEAWATLAGPADVIGVSMYRFASHKRFGIILFPYPPAWYIAERLMITPFTRDVVISELQAEPWFEDGIIPDDLSLAYSAFPADTLAAHVRYAKKTGFSEVFLWGAEWWYYLKEHGDSRLWNAAREVFHGE